MRPAFVGHTTSCTLCQLTHYFTIVWEFGQLDFHPLRTVFIQAWSEDRWLLDPLGFVCPGCQCEISGFAAVWAAGFEAGLYIFKEFPHGSDQFDLDNERGIHRRQYPSDYQY